MMNPGISFVACPLGNGVHSTIQGYRISFGLLYFGCLLLAHCTQQGTSSRPETVHGATMVEGRAQNREIVHPEVKGGTPVDEPGEKSVTVPVPPVVIRQYADSEEVPANSISMYNKIRERFESGKLPTVHSQALSGLAGHLLVFQGKPLQPSSLMEIASRWGISSPWILQNYLVASGYDDAFMAQWVAKNLHQYRSQHGITHFGFARGKKDDGSDVLVLLMQKRRLSHAPFPRWVEPGDFLTVKGTMERGTFGLEVLVTSPDEGIARMPVKLAADGSFTVRLDFCNDQDKRGFYNVELLGKDAQGPFVAALFPVGCGESYAEKKTAARMQEPTREISIDVFEKDVMDRVNEYRKRLNMKPFLHHAKLAALSRSHSEEMCQHRKIFHISGSTGSPLNRVIKAGLKPQLVAENVAMGPSPEEVVAAWIKSEGHRLNMQHAKGTHAAIGVCRGLYGTDTVLYYVTMKVAAF